MALHTILWPFCFGALAPLQPFSIITRVPGILDSLSIVPYTPCIPTHSSPASSKFLVTALHFIYVSDYAPLQLFMFFSIAVSRVAPVLFPDASDDPSSLFLAQNAAAILEKVKNVDRERKFTTARPSFLFLSK